MSRTLNPLEDFITQQAMLLRELCALAEANYGMGTDSGAKRTIMLLLAQKQSMKVEELQAVYSQQAPTKKEESYIFELKGQGYVDIQKTAQGLELSLTKSGKEKLKLIQAMEAQLASQLAQKGVPIAEIKRMAHSLSEVRNILEEMRNTIDQPSQQINRAG